MIYIAAEFKLASVARAFASRLALAGIEVTSSWHAQTDEEIARKRSPVELVIMGKAELIDIRRSRAVVTFLAHGSREAIAAGAMAIGLGIPVIVVGYQNYETRLLNQENVWWIEFFGDAFDMVRKQYGHEIEPDNA
jgi:hypothetical protein